MERLPRFLVSRRSLVGFGLAAAGLALHVLGLLTGPLWLTIVVGLYFLGVLLVPSKHAVDVRVDPGADSEAVRDGLDELVRQVQFKVAPDILARVKSIRKQILVTLEHAPDQTVTDPTVYLIRQTALDYLPSALSAYLALPRIYAERRPTMAGKTPHDVLLEQLDLMDAKMREAAEAKLAHDSERLLANGRFIADRFGTSALRLDPTPVSGARTATAGGDAERAAQTAGGEAEHIAEPAHAAAATERVIEHAAEPAPEAAEETAERERVR